MESITRIIMSKMSQIQVKPVDVAIEPWSVKTAASASPIIFTANELADTVTVPELTIPPPRRQYRMLEKSKTIARPSKSRDNVQKSIQKQLEISGRVMCPYCYEAQAPSSMTNHIKRHMMTRCAVCKLKLDVTDFDRHMERHQPPTVEPVSE